MGSGAFVKDFKADSLSRRLLGQAWKELLNKDLLKAERHPKNVDTVLEIVEKMKTLQINTLDLNRVFYSYLEKAVHYGLSK